MAINPMSASSARRSARVNFVWRTYGIIGNGGFQYLMEGDFEGDPGFRHTARAFQAIGCEPAADTFDRVLSLFPDGKPQADIDERIRHYREQFDEFPTGLDRQFFAADDAIESCLAAYIRSHAGAFAHLE